jgi:hypothetical protein
VEDLGLIRDKENRPHRLDDKQKIILSSPERRVIVNCHRQWGKSIISSLLCLHRALFFKKSLCLLVAPSLRQSSENFRKVLDILEMGDPPELEEDTKLSLKMANGSRIIALPGTQKTIRGFSSPDLIVIDEAAQASDELYQALRPMLLSSPNGRIILCSTPFGRQGFFYKIWTEGGPGWLRVEVKATENPRISPGMLEEMRLEAVFESKYRQECLCEFTEEEGAVFSTDLFRSLANPEISALKI